MLFIPVKQNNPKKFEAWKKTSANFFVLNCDQPHKKERKKGVDAAPVCLHFLSNQRPHQITFRRKFGQQIAVVLSAPISSLCCTRGSGYGGPAGPPTWPRPRTLIGQTGRGPPPPNISTINKSILTAWWLYRSLLMGRSISISERSAVPDPIAFRKDWLMSRC